MSALRPKPAVGQEWEKVGPERTVTRIRITEVSPAGALGVATVGPGGRLLRGRRLLASALTNTPKGWRLVKEPGQ